MDAARLLADRTRRIEVSGIRKVFDLGRSLKDPVNLSIGQPHFDVPEPIKTAAKAAIDRGQVRSSEAGLKYFVLGSLSSGMLLYGASLIYGFTGSIDLSVIASVAQGRPAAWPPRGGRTAW